MFPLADVYRLATLYIFRIQMPVCLVLSMGTYARPCVQVYLSLQMSGAQRVDAIVCGCVAWPQDKPITHNTEIRTAPHHTWTSVCAMS